MSARVTGALRAGLCATAIALMAPSAVFAADGYANVNGTTTGGAGGPSVTVTTLSAFTTAVADDVARIVNVSGTINLGSSSVRFGSNKTIQGVGTSSGFVGNLKAVGKNNVIIQRLNFNNKATVGDGDCITLQSSTHVWVDHCSFVDGGDGCFDITHACDWVTVSWCKFSYTADSGHNFTNLIGHSDSNAAEDTGKLHVTMHHNWYGTLAKERMPRVRFGRVHVYNNYYGAAASNYCLGVGDDCQILLENGYFEGQAMPWKNYSSSGNQGLIHWNTGSVFVNSPIPTWAPNSTVFAPPYSYSMESGSTVKTSVTAGAGSGGTGGGGGGGGGGGAVVVQSETGTWSSGGVLETTNAGWTGTGYVNTANAVGAYSEVTVNVATAGTYSIIFRHANGTTTNRPADLSINGTVVQTAVAFNGTGAWTTWTDVTVSRALNAGNNTIRLTATTANGCSNLDRVTVQ